MATPESSTALVDAPAPEVLVLAKSMLPKWMTRDRVSLGPDCSFSNPTLDPYIKALVNYAAGDRGDRAALDELNIRRTALVENGLIKVSYQHTRNDLNDAIRDQEYEKAGDARDELAYMLSDFPRDGDKPLEINEAVLAHIEAQVIPWIRRRHHDKSDNDMAL